MQSILCRLLPLVLSFVVITKAFAQEQTETAPPTISWGDPFQGLRLGLFFPQSSYRSNEPVIAFVVLENISDQSRDFLPNLPHDGITSDGNLGPPSPVRGLGGWDRLKLRFVITGPQRKLIPWRAPGSARFLELEYGQVNRVGLAPGLTLTNRYPISGHFNLTNSGNYVITARTRVSRTDIRDSVEIVSGNSIIFIESRPPPVVQNEGARYPFPAEAPNRNPPTAAGGHRPSQPPASVQSAGSGGESAIAPASAPADDGMKELQTTKGRSKLERTAVGLCFALLGLVIAILWRARRRAK